MPDDVEQLQGLYETYFQQVEAAKERLKPADGLLGMGEKLSNAPCHDAFAEALTALLEGLPDQADATQVCRMLDFIYRAPFAYPDVHQSVYWMLIAVQGLTRQAIACLRPEDARVLHAWYEKAYPRWERLPVQKQVLAALKQQGGRA